MSEEMIPEVPVTSETPVDNTPSVPEETAVEEKIEVLPDFSGMSLAELAGLFGKLMEDAERMKKSKEAEAIKSAFYKRLLKEKSDAGYGSDVKEPTSRLPEDDAEMEEDTEKTAVEPAAESAQEQVSDNPFVEIERGFKEMYNKYKKERAEYNRQLEKEREHNLTLKQAVIEDLKALLEKQEDVNATFPEFREIQNRWRAIGPVPVQSYRNLNDTYQLYVEQFYDMVKINRELRDLDFKKNLEVKEKFMNSGRNTARLQSSTESPSGIGSRLPLQS